MNEVVSLRKVEVEYPGSGVSLRISELKVEERELVLLLGPSGSGKSTLLKLLSGIIPEYQRAAVRGEVEVVGVDPREKGLSGMVRAGVGIVFQNPDAQLFSAIVKSEVSFGPENLGLPSEEVAERVKWALKVVGISELEEQDTVKLSGGQKQRVAIASILALKPKLLLLDEPVSQLDPQGSISVMKYISKLPHEAGCTVILAEHRLHDLYVARVLRENLRTVVLYKGSVVFDGELREAINNRVLEKYGVREPGIIKAAKKLYGSVPTLKREELIKLLSAFPQRYSNAKGEETTSRRVILEVRDLWVRYSRREPFVLKGVSLVLREGEVVALMGANASGKTTLMRAVAGLLKPARGEIKLSIDPQREIAFIPQNPDLYLVSNTVLEELALNPRNTLDESLAKNLVEELELGEFLNRHPHSLSRGQRFRVAVAAALAGKPRLVMLDEPTTGQDQKNIDALARILEKYVKAYSACALVSTHDVEFVLHHCSKVIVLKDGKVLASGPPRLVLRNEKVTREACLRTPDEVLVELWS